MEQNFVHDWHFLAVFGLHLGGVDFLNLLGGADCEEELGGLERIAELFGQNAAEE